MWILLLLSTLSKLSTLTVSTFRSDHFAAPPLCTPFTLSSSLHPPYRLPAGRLFCGHPAGPLHPPVLQPHAAARTGGAARRDDDIVGLLCIHPHRPCCCCCWWRGWRRQGWPCRRCGILCRRRWWRGGRRRWRDDRCEPGHAAQGAAEHQVD